MIRDYALAIGPNPHQTTNPGRAFTARKIIDKCRIKGGGISADLDVPSDGNAGRFKEIKRQPFTLPIMDRCGEHPISVTMAAEIALLPPLDRFIRVAPSDPRPQRL